MTGEKDSHIHSHLPSVRPPNGADVTRRDAYGQTQLHITTSLRCSVEATRLLIEQGAEVEARTEETGETPLHVATREGKSQLAEVFLHHGADVNAKDRYGETPIISATATGKSDILEFRVTNGADSESRNIPLGIAKRLGKTEIAVIPRQHGAQE